MSNKHDVTIIAGLSGVGKTYIIKRLMCESQGYIHLSAGSLIKKRLASTDTNQLHKLNRNNILANQYLMVEQLKEELSVLNNRCAILLDAHMIIDNEQEIVQVPYEIFQQISPTKLIILSDDAKSIVERRERDRSRKRPVRTVSEIMAHQEISLILAQEYCDKLSIPLIQITAGDITTLINTMSQIK